MPRTGATIAIVGNSSVSGTASFGGDISCGNIKSKDANGIVIKTSEDIDSMKIWNNKNVDIYGGAFFAQNVTSNGQTTNTIDCNVYGNLAVTGTISAPNLNP